MDDAEPRPPTDADRSGEKSGGRRALLTGIGIGGAMRDTIGYWIERGWLGPAFDAMSDSYTVVYQFEVFLLFVTLVVIGPLAKFAREAGGDDDGRIGLTEFPR